MQSLESRVGRPEMGYMVNEFFATVASLMEVQEMLKAENISLNLVSGEHFRKLENLPVSARGSN